MKHAKKRKMNIKKVIKLLLLVILCGSLTYIAIWFYQTELDKKQIADLEKEVLITDKEQAEAKIKEIDFDKLFAINSDVKGWLEIEQLGISYPILQSNDNQFYLKKDIYKNDNISGSIFLDYRNHEFQDNNTVIYGHNMRNNTMFGNLEKIRKGQIGNDIDIIIQTKDKIYQYKVFSTYEIEPKEFDINEEIEIVLRKSEIDFQREIDTNNKYLTLYTCTNTSVKRTIVHAVLEEEEFM